MRQVKRAVETAVISVEDRVTSTGKFCRGSLPTFIIEGNAEFELDVK